MKRSAPKGSHPSRVVPAVVTDISSKHCADTVFNGAQALRSAVPTRSWFVYTFRREAGTAVLLGLGCGVVVSAIVLFWRGDALAAVAIGGSIGLSLITACLFGLSVPSLLHWLKLDPKIAAGPVTLAFTDFFALLFYFGTAALVL